MNGNRGREELFLSHPGVSPLQRLSARTQPSSQILAGFATGPPKPGYPVFLLILRVTPYLSEKLLGMIKPARADLCCVQPMNPSWHRTLDRIFFWQLFIYDFSGSSLLWAGFSLVATNRGYSAVVQPPHARDLYPQHTGPRAWAWQLWLVSLVIESSWTKDWTHVAGISRRILYHWITREVTDTELWSVVGL